MKKSLLSLLAISGLWFSNGCGGGNSITTTPPPATHFSVTPATATPTAGTAFMVTVTSLTASGQTATSYSGTLHFTSSDALAVLPADTAMTSATGTFSVTLNTSGSQTITATAAALTGTSNAITVSAVAAGSPVPLINQPLSPAAVVPGGAGFTLTVNGAGFTSGSKVMWNGSVRATNFVNKSQLTASVLAADVANSNTASVTVVNPAPGGISNVVFFETTTPTASVGLSSAPALTVGSNPSSMTTADLTANGKLDLVVTNSGSNNIGIFLGNDNGTFQSAVDYPVGMNPAFVAVGDFNGDGKLDLAVANNGSNDVSILLGKGDGTFQAAVSYAVGTGPTALAIGDFDGDGKLDLAVTNGGSNNVSILLGKGDGTFQTAVEYGAGSVPNWVAVGDFNGDGKLDLAVANSVSNNVSILLGKGDGTFQTAVDYATGTNCYSVAVGDFNGDGKLDLAVANRGTSNFVLGTVGIFLGDGDGTFKAAVNYEAGYSSLSLVLGDFNGDGKLDLAVSNTDTGGNFSAGSVSIFLGRGDGTFQAKMDHAAGSNPSSLAVGDFNGDGRLDLVVGDQQNSTASVLLQPGLVSGPNASLSATSLNFVSQLVGTTSPAQSVQLTNYGTAALDLTGIAAPANFGETDNCGLSLAAGASCTINVTFAPTAIGGLAGALTITDNAPGGSQAISLTGTGTEVDLAPSQLRFNCSATSCPSQNVMLTNKGATPLSITSITTSSPRVGTGHAFNETNNCPASLLAGQFCTITVTFNGVFQTGYKGTLNVADNGGGSPQTVNLSGIID